MTAIAPEQPPPASVKKSISLPAELLEQAMKRARDQHRSFSSYLQSLVASDLRDEETDVTTSTK